MNIRAIKAITKKDLSSVTSNVQIILPIIIVPLIFCVVFPAILILISRFSDLNQATNLEPILKILEKLPEESSLAKDLATFTDLNQKLIFLFFNYFFAPMFLLIPIMGASLVAANSFAGEKERRTLESLLFAPVDIFSLFLGKVLAAFILAMGLAIGGFILYGLTINILGYPLFNRAIFPQSNWLVLLFWVIPSFSFLAILFNVAVSAKVKGFQEANQMSVFVVLPIIFLLISQILGAFIIDTKFLWLLGGGGLFISVIVLWRMIGHFDRNRLFESQIF